MPPRALKRVTVPQTRGICYNGDNFGEVLDFYLTNRYNEVTVNVKTKAIEMCLFEDSMPQKLSVGDWVVQEDREKFIVGRNEFAKKFVEEPPQGYVAVSTETGKEVKF